MKQYILSLQDEFKRNANPAIARGQKAYMKNKFEFYGITALQRKKLQKPFLMKQHLPPRRDLSRLVKKLWRLPQREYQMFAQELVHKFDKELVKEDIALLEYMITHKSWWDTVDFIAANMVGQYFKLYPQLRSKILTKWLKSGNIWLQRSVLVFQLKYKAEVDVDLLSRGIKYLLGSKEFFINKAIGWALRQYGKTNPGWVISFVSNNTLHPLSRREALRLIV